MPYTRKGLQVLWAIVEGESSLDIKVCQCTQRGRAEVKNVTFSFNGRMKLILFFLYFSDP